MCWESVFHGKLMWYCKENSWFHNEWRKKKKAILKEILDPATCWIPYRQHELKSFLHPRWRINQGKNHRIQKHLSHPWKWITGFWNNDVKSHGTGGSSEQSPAHDLWARLSIFTWKIFVPQTEDSRRLPLPIPLAEIYVTVIVFPVHFLVKLILCIFHSKM